MHPEGVQGNIYGQQGVYLRVADTSDFVADDCV
jgi:hypothetical protein